MKSFIRLFFSFLLASTLLTSCNKEERLKNQYIEACADGNFDNARAVVEKLESVSSLEAREGMKYVNDKEIYYLLAKPSNDNNARILYLYNTYEEDQLPDMSDVVEVAISTGNDNLATKLINSGVWPNNQVSIAAVNAEMPQILELIVKKNPKTILEQQVKNYYKEEFGTEEFKTLLAELYRNSTGDTKEKVISLAETENIPEASEWIKENLEEKLKKILSTNIPSRPALGMVKSDLYGELPSEYKAYTDEVSDHNGKIREFITEAVSCGQIGLAKKALSDMKPTLESKVIGDWVRVVEHKYDHSSVYNALQVSENRNDITEASKIIQNGIRK